MNSFLIVMLLAMLVLLGARMDFFKSKPARPGAQVTTQVNVPTSALLPQTASPASAGLTQGSATQFQAQALSANTQAMQQKMDQN